MRAIRTYKINVRENPLRTLVFSNKNIIISLGITLTGLTFYLMKNFDVIWRIIVSFTLLAFSMVILSMKIDNQPMYEVLYRMFFYIFRNRNERF